MTKPHRLTPEQWDDIEQWAKAGFLELLSRVKSLEEDCYQENKSSHFCIEAIVKRLEKLEKTIFTDQFYL